MRQGKCPGTIFRTKDVLSYKYHYHHCFLKYRLKVWEKAPIFFLPSLEQAPFAIFKRSQHTFKMSMYICSYRTSFRSTWRLLHFLVHMTTHASLKILHKTIMATQQWTHSHMMVMSFYNYSWQNNILIKISQSRLSKCQRPKMIQEKLNWHHNKHFGSVEITAWQLHINVKGD